MVSRGVSLGREFKVLDEGDGVFQNQVQQATDGTGKTCSEDSRGAGLRPRLQRVPEGLQASAVAQVPEGLQSSAVAQVQEGFQASAVAQVPEGPQFAAVAQLPEGPQVTAVAQVAEGPQVTAVAHVAENLRSPQLLRLPNLNRSCSGRRRSPGRGSC